MVKFPKPFQSWPHIGQRWPIYNQASEQAAGLYAWWPGLASYPRPLLREFRKDFTSTFADAPAWVFNSEMGPGLSVDGSNDEIAVAGEDIGSTSLSIAAWVLFPGLSGTTFAITPGTNPGGVIFSTRSLSADKSPTFCVSSADGGTGTAKGVTFVFDTVNVAVGVKGATTIQANTLYHIVGRFNNTGAAGFGGIWDVFVNGLQDNVSSNNFVLAGSASLPFTGTTWNILQHPLWPTSSPDTTATIFDLRLYKVALSDSAIQSQFESPWELYEIPRRLWAFAPPPAAGTITPTGIASLEAFGASQVDLILSPSGIAGLEAFGAAQVDLILSPSGIAGLEAFGASQVDLILSPSGIAGLEAFGTTQVSGGAQIIPSGIASLEVFGTSQINLTVSPTGLVSLEAFGATLVDLILSPSGIAGLEAFGAAQVDLILSPSGIAGLEAFGTSQVDLILSPSGIAGLEAFGTTLVSVSILALRPSGIASGESFGFTNVNIIFLALLYSINGGTPISGVFADWERVALRRNPDGTTAYSPWAVNIWQLSQMLMAEFEELRAQQGAALASLETNDINSRNAAATYTTVILESVVNGGHEGIKALNVNIRFRVKVT